MTLSGDTEDLEAPTVTLSGDIADGAITNSQSITFTFSATDNLTDPVTNIQCSLDSVAFTSCPNLLLYSDLLDGAHTFAVKAFDEAANSATTPDYSWTVDTEAPSASITYPSGIIPVDAINMTGTTNDPTAKISVSISDSTPTEIFSGVATVTGTIWNITAISTVAPLPDLSYTINVATEDTLGNKNTTAATGSFTIDTSLPLVIDYDYTQLEYTGLGYEYTEETQSLSVETIDSVNTPYTHIATVTTPLYIPTNTTPTDLIEANSVSIDQEILSPEAIMFLQFDNLESNASLQLDGDGDYLQISNQPATNDLTTLTLSMWVKPDYSHGSQEFTVISKEKSFSLSINNKIIPEKIAKFSVFDGIKWTTVESTSTINEEWTFLAATFNGESISIYVNGELEGTEQIIGVLTVSFFGIITTTTVDHISSEEDIVIGAYINTKNYPKSYNEFSGEIDDVSLYDSLLGEEQIREVYEQQVTSYNERNVEISLEELYAAFLEIVNATTDYIGLVDENSE